jgi:hypothetical protein
VVTKEVGCFGTSSIGREIGALVSGFPRLSRGEIYTPSWLTILMPVLLRLSKRVYLHTHTHTLSLSLSLSPLTASAVILQPEFPYRCLRLASCQRDGHCTLPRVKHPFSIDRPLPFSHGAVSQRWNPLYLTVRHCLRRTHCEPVTSYSQEPRGKDTVLMSASLRLCP